MTEPLTPEQLRAIAHLSKYDIFPQGSAESAVQLLLREVERLKQENSNLAEAYANLPKLFEEAHVAEIKRLKEENARLRESWTMLGDSEMLTGYVRLRSELAAAQQKALAQWQPIETVPKDGTKILLAWRSGEIQAIAIDSEGFFYPHHPSHWMPLPDPPNRNPPSLRRVRDERTID